MLLDWNSSGSAESTRTSKPVEIIALWSRSPSSMSVPPWLSNPHITASDRSKTHVADVAIVDSDSEQTVRRSVVETPTPNPRQCIVSEPDSSVAASRPFVQRKYALGRNPVVTVMTVPAAPEIVNEPVDT